MFMNSVNLFERISIDLPYKNIYQRLGFKKTMTELTARQRKETDSLISEAAAGIVLRGAILRKKINENNGNRIFLEGEITFSSVQLSSFLRDCGEAVLLGATAGNDIMDAIREMTVRDNLTAAVVYDATASEMTDAALDWIMDYANRQLWREGKKLLPRRFSAGYGDFSLENQKIIHEELQMGKIDVKINSNFILVPEKSVTAISGICG
jgi:cobalamin-dependent methionine synthase I